MPPDDRYPDGGSDLGAAVSALYDLTLQLREQCPWDRAQTAGTIVPHTLEEAYEVADAVRALERAEAGTAGTAGEAAAADEAPLGVDAARSAVEDELGDLLFQVCFLAMLCAEQDPSIGLASVARAIHAKLVRRHPHVFGDAVAGDADAVRGAWEQVKRDGEGRDELFGGIPAAMPAVSQARKLQSRAAGIGFDFPNLDEALAKLQEEVAELREAIADAAARGTLPRGEQAPADAHVEWEVGDVLFAAVNVARLTRSDPELALSGTSRRFRGRVERATELAAQSGEQFSSLDQPRQEHWYQLARKALLDEGAS